MSPALRRSGDKKSWTIISVFLCLLFTIVQCFPDPGKFTIHMDSSKSYAGIVKNMYNGTKIFIKVECDPKSPNTKPYVNIGWLIRETKCWNEYAFLEATEAEKTYEMYFQNPKILEGLTGYGNKTNYAQQLDLKLQCETLISLPTIDKETTVQSDQVMKKSKRDTNSIDMGNKDGPQYTIKHDGDYLLIIHMESDAGNSQLLDSTITISMEGTNGYLSVVDWPLLPFYGLMCGLYVAMGLGWLVVCALHWRDLLRIQFWIGAVIFLGMLEKALFYAEFQNINSTGIPTKNLIIMAEVVSCAKRTLARMLVIIVSLGFGIVKPRLGQTLHRIVGIGLLYFVIASTEAVLRVIKPKNDLSSGTMLAGIPLAVIDSSICWWVFSALVQTTRTLRLRRNLVKLSLYRHFTNTLIFAVLASVVFMLWSIKFHKLEDCLTDWRDLWIDEAFWHLLFSTILLVIMILWTPSKNNQRYAFTPLLDNEEDEDSEEEALYTDAYEGMKLRSKSRHGSGEENGSIARKADEDDPLKWIEENIPESAENPLPVIDSDEEIETTKLEINKMQ